MIFFHTMAFADYVYDGDFSDWPAQCQTGHWQSPIDLPSQDQSATTGGWADVRFWFRPSTYRVSNDGHHMQWLPNRANTLTHAGQTFTLMQFHAHTPSEHTFDHVHFPGVLHWVYKSASDQLAVVAIMIRAGAFNPQFAQWLRNIPRHQRTTAFEGHVLSPQGLWPHNTSFFSLEGSLTTPPCTEGVHWLVIQKPLDVSVGQLAILRQYFGQNNRPLQAQNHRDIHMLVPRLLHQRQV